MLIYSKLTYNLNQNVYHNYHSTNTPKTCSNLKVIQIINVTQKTHFNEQYLKTNSIKITLTRIRKMLNIIR